MCHLNTLLTTIAGLVTKKKMFLAKLQNTEGHF